MICVIDACFVIDWSLYGRRDILKDIFSSFYITADVFDELKSERAYNMIIEWRRENICVIVGLTERELNDVRALMRRVDENPEMPAIDFPEATAIIYAKKYGIQHVLTENKGAKAVPTSLNDFSEIKIWSALDVLKEAGSKGILRDFEKALEEYSTETKHIFKEAKKEKKINAQIH